LLRSSPSRGYSTGREEASCWASGSSCPPSMKCVDIFFFQVDCSLTQDHGVIIFGYRILMYAMCSISSSSFTCRHMPRGHGSTWGQSAYERLLIAMPRNK
jgi:hypothetical protein